MASANAKASPTGISFPVTPSCTSSGFHRYLKQSPKLSPPRESYSIYPHRDMAKNIHSGKQGGYIVAVARQYT